VKEETASACLGSTQEKTVCAEAEVGSYGKNGGFAEYLLADPNCVAHVPDGLAAGEPVPLTCLGITTYKGIKETAAKPRQCIAVSVAGALGLI
jgi:propanol-preferring alcohol dehydrogenase